MGNVCCNDNTEPGSDVPRSGGDGPIPKGGVANNAKFAEIIKMLDGKKEQLVRI